jgi:hypothetical protein
MFGHGHYKYVKDIHIDLSKPKGRGMFAPLDTKEVLNAKVYEVTASN